MATFSTNQVRHLYVVEQITDGSAPLTATDPKKKVSVHSDTTKNHLYFEYMGAGGMTRSDLISTDNILYAKATKAEDLAHKLAKYKLTLDTTVNGGKPIAGQDYLLRIVFKNYIGLSEEDQYFKYGMVHAVSGMQASDFYKTLAISLVKNFSREEKGLLKFYLETEGTEAGKVATTVEVTNDTKESALTGTYTGLVIEEAPQDWILGVKEQTTVNFTLLPDAVLDSGDERIWGVVKQVPSTSTVKDGHKIADLEYFCMGDRGDLYRFMGFPNVIRTTYFVDPDKEYDVLDLHYAFAGANESVQKSEKDITFVVPRGETTQEFTVINKLIAAVNTATGLNIASLSL